MEEKTCTIHGCDKPLFYTGLCQAHYRRKDRGATEEEMLKPVRATGHGMVRITGFMAIKQVAELMKSVAKSQGISVFELNRRIVYRWFEDTTNTSIEEIMEQDKRRAL